MSPQQAGPATMPVTVTGHLERDLSRWLWLVKWLLLVPHGIILFFLWVAATVLSIVAWFAILVTGRYPRSIFDFNLGVLRWSWRVWFYSYGALGTDRYPPFTLGPAPDYPATLDIAYPERLSRGLVLVKSWLLAIPHYLVLGFFLGAGAAADASWDGPPWPWSVGLVGLLVVVAAIVLLFTGRYPGTVFDLVLGMDRWAIRVAAYALLMTDAYPPFRLDQGGDEPAGVAPRPGAGGSAFASGPPTPEQVPAPAPSPAAHPTVAPAPAPMERTSTPRRWTPLRIVSLSVGCVLLALSLGLGLGGVGLLVADKGLRDDDGFLMTGGERFTTASYAVTTETVRLEGGSVLHSLIGDVRLTARSADGPVFLGIARSDDVDDYLAGVAHAVVVDLDDRPLFREFDGGAPATAPADALTWDAQASGEGRVTLEWDAGNGDWTAVLMNADGSADVSAVVSAGATLPVIGWGAVTLLVTGVVLLVVGLVLVLVALPRSNQPATTSPTS